ncbi:MAG: hypothetical protein HUU57_06230 [Bdellovibrio sp.]|nr:hypothetical protein [Bdellovibrio sp.]
MKNNSAPGYVFLTECHDFGQAQVIKSYLESLGFHPRVRDEQTRSVAPHLSQFLGRLTIDIPEIEFMAASEALEAHEVSRPTLVTDPTEEENLAYTQNMAKKALWNAILGSMLIPVICNVYSMILGYRVLKYEKPFSAVSRKRLFWAVAFNSFAFYFWLTIAPHFIKTLLR